LEEVEPNHFKLNKQLLIKNFLESTKFERKFCSKYNDQIIKSEIEKLPNQIFYFPLEDYEIFQRKYREAYEQGGQKLSDTLREILNNSEIDSNLSIDDILKCSNAISLLSYN